MEVSSSVDEATLEQHENDATIYFYRPVGYTQLYYDLGNMQEQRADITTKRTERFQGYMSLIFVSAIVRIWFIACFFFNFVRLTSRPFRLLFRLIGIAFSIICPHFSLVGRVFDCHF